MIGPRQSNDLLKGTLMLTFAALLTKVLSAFYRIPFQNLVGDVGFYIYQQVYPFYGIALVLSTYGFPVIISKLYIEKKSKFEQTGARALIIASLLILTLVGILLFILLYFGSAILANTMNDPSLAVLLKAIAPTFLLLPLLSVLRGYFQGSGDLGSTAISQVGEQLFRVTTILIVALVLRDHNLYDVGAGAMWGSFIGGLVSVGILLWFLAKKKPMTLHMLRQEVQLSWKSVKKIAQPLLVHGVAISISSMLLLFIQLADSMSLYSLLVQSGELEQVAKEWKGVYDRGIPLIQLGTVVATSMSLAIVPLISSERIRQKKEDIQDKVRIALLISLVVGIGASVGLISIIRPTNAMLFENTKGSNLLALQSSVILLSSFIITVLAILQGFGRTMFTASVVILSGALKYGLNFFLVPIWGVSGAALSTIISLTILAVIIFLKLSGEVQGEFLKGKELSKIAISAFMMFLLLKGIAIMTRQYIPEPTRIQATGGALSGVLLGGTVYLFFIIRLNTFKERELVLLPFGSKLIKFLPKTNRS